ncbi:MAG: excinuclease ABC subunit UvrA [Polyangiaceae bacterium]
MHPIVLRGARAHNLKGVDLELRPGELVGLAGVSGAGKSSLALDTLYAEGQRRFVESFSPYARQFLERLDRPAMDELDPVAAGVAVDRRAPVKSSRSTVATMADIEPYLSALFAREALPLCPTCGVLAERSDPEIVARRLTKERAGERAVVTYSIRVDGTELFLDARERLLRAGYRRVLVDGKARDLDDVAPSELALGAGDGGTGKGRLDVVIDRLACVPADAPRLAAALEEAWQRADAVRAEHDAPSAEVHFTPKSGPSETIAVARGLVCPKCATAFEPPTSRLFSYQSPIGACGTCRGFGRTIGIDWDKVVPDPSKSLLGGAIRAWSGKSSQMERGLLKKFCARKGIPMDAPWGELTPAQRAMVIEGEGSWSGGKYPGVKAWFEYLETRTYKMHVRVLLSRYRAYDPCKACGGKRLSPRSLTYRVAGLDLGAWHALEIREARALLGRLSVGAGQGKLALAELEARLGHLERVGLGYLSLDRQARSLSGGEAQRVSLTAALGTHLTGALFVLDEPTVGLHPSDLPPLIEAMQELARRGNVVVVIEHDPLVLRACDRIVELGPGAGTTGGAVTFDGPPARAAADTALATARALSGLGVASVARAPRGATGGAVRVIGARGHNLKSIDVEIPLGVVVAITGPSGSGKSSLADGTLFRTLARMRGHRDVEAPLPCVRLEGAELVKDVLLVDQAPLGRTSRGNPATYTGAWDRVRALFAKSPIAEARKLGPGHFSFNVAGGRCDACSGEGAETVEMQFLSDVTLVCPSCQGRRFKPEILEVRLFQHHFDGPPRELGVDDVLALTVDEALEVFEADSGIVRALSPLAMLGVGYLTLGQSLSTLSGGEAQRLKLARALSEVKRGTLIVMDEPSAGLHVDEVSRVNEALSFLVQRGASVVAVDHDLDLIGAADWVIELGPRAGSGGGEIVAAGSPAELRRRGTTKTGKALAEHGERRPPLPADRGAAPAPAPRAIEIVAAREHNLKSVSTSIPHGKITVVTGPSGSGKSTLAFDVVFAEGQRRFLEPLTPYARQFLPTMPRPDVDRVLGIPPAVALEQRTTRSGPSSTVATVTEIGHYLRLLYAKVGDLHCPECDTPIAAMSIDEALRRARDQQGAVWLLAPAVEARKGTYLDLFNQAARAGLHQAFVDGELAELADPPRLKKSVEHTIDLVAYEGKARDIDRPSFVRALTFGKNSVKLRRVRDGKETRFSTDRSCPSCGTSVPELDPRWFSFNTKQGQCPTCEGAGEDEHGRTCRDCRGARLAPLPRSVRLHGARYHEYLSLGIDEALARARAWKFEGAKSLIAETPRAELLRRLGFVSDVGLDYLSLGRLASTLSGGEMQRLRLAAQLGAGLTGALYVLDEPTIGLHPRDTHRLLRNLRALADTGSTVLLVEHDADTIRAADHLIDLGPTGGRGGGRIVASGTAAEVLGKPGTASPTARALADEASLTSARVRLGPAEQAIELHGARAHNLRVPKVAFPIGRLTVVAGVSGSGKSTLVSKVLFPAVRRALGLEAEAPLAHDRVVVPPSIARAVLVDQSPIGRTPRSVPATFLGIWDDLRRLFAATTDAKTRGFGPTRFSFNSATGGRCTACDGQGATSHEMSFLPDVTTVCPACRGARFEPETLRPKYLGRDIGEVLDLSAEEAAQVFAAHPRIASPLAVMHDLGVGYLKLGQGSPTLSGGEAQRLKLAAELSVRTHTKPTLYVLDEPTTGLHWSDVVRLVGVLDRLVRRGDTLVVIEHHPGVIACADHVVELGPEGGARGGELVAAMAPQDLARRRTATGAVLEQLFRAPISRAAHRSETMVELG